MISAKKSDWYFEKQILQIFLLKIPRAALRIILRVVSDVGILD